MSIAAFVIAGAGGAVWWLRRRFVVVSVVGVSMEPVLREGQRVLVRRAGVAAMRHGDVVVFANPVTADCLPDDPPWLIKRVIALGGDPVPPEAVPANNVHAVVPDGTVVVRGDNHLHSLDSRKVGFISGDALLGVVVRTLAGPQAAVVNRGE